jgi:hypothetical protein
VEEDEHEEEQEVEEDAEIGRCNLNCGLRTTPAAGVIPMPVAMLWWLAFETLAPPARDRGTDGDSFGVRFLKEKEDEGEGEEEVE